MSETRQIIVCSVVVLGAGYKQSKISCDPLRGWTRSGVFTIKDFARGNSQSNILQDHPLGNRLLSSAKAQPFLVRFSTYFLVWIHALNVPSRKSWVDKASFFLIFSPVYWLEWSEMSQMKARAIPHTLSYRIIVSPRLFIWEFFQKKLLNKTWFFM